jgi:pSer/pThr/pTyr-binding forkhead associated (FHA) protein
MLAKLIPIDGSAPIELTEDVTVVGRKQGICDLIVDRNSVSKLHCLVVKTDGLLFVRDLGSTNGTKVNGQRVTRGALLPGDELAFASAKFRVHLGPGEPEAGNHDRTEMLDGIEIHGNADEFDSALISDSV